MTTDLDTARTAHDLAYEAHAANPNEDTRRAFLETQEAYNLAFLIAYYAAEPVSA